MWSDRETPCDCLGYMGYVEVLTQVCLRRDLSPLTLGVFGAWESGKTSLMLMQPLRRLGPMRHRRNHTANVQVK
jgi:hypothetical protein